MYTLTLEETQRDQVSPWIILGSNLQIIQCPISFNFQKRFGIINLSCMISDPFISMQVSYRQNRIPGLRRFRTKAVRRLVLSCDAAELKELKSALDSSLTELGCLWTGWTPPNCGNFSRETTGKFKYMNMNMAMIDFWGTRFLDKP